MKTFSLKSASVNMLLSIDCSYDIFGNDFLESYIPSVFYREIEYEGEMYDLIIKKSNTVKFSKNEIGSFIFEYNEQTTYRDLISVIEYVFEYLRNMARIYCLHGSACLIGDHLLVFWGGASGMGKTRTAKLLSDKLGAVFIFDEKILLSSEGVVGGINKMYTHKEVYKSRTEFLNLPKSFLTDKPQRKVIFFYVHNLGDSSNEFEFRLFDEKEFSWHLYEELTRKIRGCSRRVNNFSIPLMSLDDDIISHDRSMISNEIATKFKSFFVRSSEDGIVVQINKLYEKT